MRMGMDSWVATQDRPLDTLLAVSWGLCVLSDVPGLGAMRFALPNKRPPRDNSRACFTPP